MDTKIPHMGICALCRLNKTLKNSHLIPAWAYKYLRNTRGGPIDPIHVVNGSAYITSKQISKHLLCEECEELFSTRENYVSQLTDLSAGGRIRFLDNCTRTTISDTELIVLGREIDIEQVVYFAASVLWRSAVMQHGCKLGSYEEKFRLYLLGKAEFPGNAAIHIIVPEPSSIVAQPERILTFPSSMKVGSNWKHGFMLCGLMFHLYIGSSLDQATKYFCLVKGNPVKYALPMVSRNIADFREAAKATRAATPRGKLAKLMRPIKL